MIKKANKFVILTMLAASVGATLTPALVQAQQADRSSSLKIFLDRDIARRREYISTQEKGIAEFRKVLQSAKSQRTVSIVVNSLQTIGAVFLTKALLQIMNQKTGITIAVGAGALVAGEAVFSAKIKFDNVAKLEKSLDDAEATLAEQRKDLEALHDSFSRLGDDARIQLKEIVKARGETLAAAKTRLEEYQAQLADAKKSRDIKNGIKIPVYSVSGIAAAIGVGSFIAAKHARDFGPLMWGVIGTIAFAGAGASYSIMSKVVSVSETQFQTIEKKTNDLAAMIKAEEATRQELVYVLSN